MEHPKADRVPVDTVWVVTMRTWVFQFPKYIFSQLLILPAWPKASSTGREDGGKGKGERRTSIYWAPTIFSNNCPTPVLFFSNSYSEHIYYVAPTIIVSSIFKPKKKKKTDIECLVWLPWSHRTRCFVPNSFWPWSLYFTLWNWCKTSSSDIWCIPMLWGILVRSVALHLVHPELTSQLR